MKFEVVKDFDTHKELLESLIHKSRAHRLSRHALFSDLQDVKAELRKRRMAFLGSSVPLSSIVCHGGAVDDEDIAVLGNYLADLTVHFWGKRSPACEQFCHQFYILTIKAAVNPSLQTPYLDDLIQLAELLTYEPKSIFISVMKDLLPEDWHGLLFRFTDSIESKELRFHLTASFEDAVLGAVAVCLGVLEEPLFDEEENISIDEGWEGGVICV